MQNKDSELYLLDKIYEKRDERKSKKKHLKEDIKGYKKRS